MSRKSPSQLYKEIFVEAHRAGFLKDGKALADAVTELTAEELFEEYHFLKKEGDFDIEAFIEAYFEFPVARENKFESDTTASLADHIDRLWPFLKRKADKKVEGSSRIVLPHPYIVPGGRFNEIYYWDSYFTMLGLRASGENRLVKQMLDNFKYLIDEYGFIPNGSRSYFLTRSQPPFFSLMVELWMEIEGEAAGSPYLGALVREYSYWMHGVDRLSGTHSTHEHVVQMPEGEQLNRYYDHSDQPRDEMYGDDLKLLATYAGDDSGVLMRNIRAACESGWDFSSRWLEKSDDLSAIKTLDIVPVDLNCLLYHLESLLSKLYLLAGDPVKSQSYQSYAENRRAAILKYHWHAATGYFHDYDRAKLSCTPSITAAGMFPLYFKIASEEQAASVTKVLEAKLLAAGGVLTTDQTTYQQWDAPNGWAPLQWIAILGCRNYDHEELADTIKSRWLALNEQVFRNTGKMLEKYNVNDTTLEGGGGEYPVQDGFGWTNGVARALLAE